MRELALSELHLLSDAQLERVIARCTELRADDARFRLSQLRRRGSTRHESDHPPAPSAFIRQVHEVHRVNRQILDETAMLERCAAGFLGRIGISKTLSFAGRRFSTAARPIIDRIESLYRERRELEALSATMSSEESSPTALAESELSEYVIRLRLHDTYVLLDLRLKPTKVIRKIQRMREAARKATELQRQRAQEAKQRKREGRTAGSKRDEGRGKEKPSAVEPTATPPAPSKAGRQTAPAAPSHPPSQGLDYPSVPPAPTVPMPAKYRSPQLEPRGRRGTARTFGRRDPNFLRSKVYVLALEQGKFYVGRCTNFPVRVKYHIEGRGAGWTKMYRPIASHAFFWGYEAEEKAVTLHYMDLYGLENVRGWVFAKAGEYEDGVVAAIRRTCEPPIPLQQLEVCDSLFPMPLECSPRWALNRHKKTGSAIFRDEQAW